MRVSLLKDNVLQDDITHQTIYKISLIKKPYYCYASSKTFLRTVMYIMATQSLILLITSIKTVNWNTVKTTGAKASSSKKMLHAFSYSWKVSEY